MPVLKILFYITCMCVSVHMSAGACGDQKWALDHVAGVTGVCELHGMAVGIKFQSSERTELALSY